MAELTGRTKTAIQTARSPGVRKDFSTRDLIPITTINNNNNNNNNSNSIVNNHLEILGTSYCVYTTSTRMKSGSFAKYGDCWNRDKNISPKIPRPFPVARTQIVEPVLLLNLKLYTVLVLT